MQRTGFFQLETPEDLFQKLHHDYERLKHSPGDVYAAFDFFVTATQLPEWYGKSGRTRPPRSPHAKAVFRLCGKLGNGAKHFSMDCRLPRGHDVREGAFDPNAFNGVAFDTGGDLIIYLDDEDGDLTAVGKPSLTVMELATLVLSDWQEVFGFSFPSNEM